jgi:phage replication-related protein YjqB (UPF0714/DUF867 family)
MRKRGISQLLTIVFLIGLTIVLALLVLFFVNRLFLDNTQDEPLANCLNDVDLSYGTVCLDAGNLRVKITNNNDATISKFVFIIHHSAGVVTDDINTGLGPYSSANFFLPYNAALNYEGMEVVPVFDNGGEIIHCNSKYISFSNDDLETCGGGAAPICGDGNKNQGSEECDKLDNAACTPWCTSLGKVFNQCDNEDLIDDDPLEHPGVGCTCVCDDIPPVPLDFDILDVNVGDDFWYPMKIQVRNNGPEDIHGFEVDVGGAGGNDLYVHRHSVYAGDTKWFNVFSSPGVGNINQITLTPGKKSIAGDGSVSWDWRGVDQKVWVGGPNGADDWSNVLSYWTFKQEGVADTIYDKSPNTINLFTNPADVPIWKYDKRCLFGRCYYMDGFENGVQATGSSAYFDTNTGNEITIEAVVRPWRIKTGSEDEPEGPVPKNRFIVSRYDEDAYTERSWMFRLDETTETPRFRIYWDQGAGDSYRTVDPDDPNYVFTVGAVWHHLVAQYDGDEGRMYVDGKLVGTSSWGSVQPIIDSPISELMVGDWQVWGGDTFNGRIESVAVYNKYLDEATIQKHSTDLLELADCPGIKRDREPDHCFHLERYGIDNSININSPGGSWNIDSGNYYGLKEYVDFSNPGNCDVAIMAVHGGNMEVGTEQMATYIYNELSSRGQDVALWVYGSRNVDCSNCEAGCEMECHHVTSGAMDPECDPYLREILSECKVGVALHGCAGGCPATGDTGGLPPILVGGRAEYEFKDMIVTELGNRLGGNYFYINFDDVSDCKYFVDDVSCYRGANHCNIVNQFPTYGGGLPGIQLEMPPEMRVSADVLLDDSQCLADPAGCFDRFETDNIWGDTLLASDAYVDAIENYIAFKGW